jgi:hypothetical protein
MIRTASIWNSSIRIWCPGIILVDEYNDPPWPGCNKAVDEFLMDKPEVLERIESDNYEKWFFAKIGQVSTP